MLNLLEPIVYIWWFLENSPLNLANLTHFFELKKKKSCTGFLLPLSIENLKKKEEKKKGSCVAQIF